MNDKAHLQNTLLRLDILAYETIEKHNINSETDFGSLPDIAKKAVRWLLHGRIINTLLLMMPKCALIRDNTYKFWDHEVQRATQTLQTKYSPDTEVLAVGYPCTITPAANKAS